MRRIDTTYWKVFRVGELFDIIGGKGITKNEIFEHQGSLPAIQSGEENFGCIGYIDKDYCVKQKYSISKGECLTVARSGSSGYVGYQAAQCVVGDSAKILEPKFEANTLRLLFLRSALMVNKVKYAYTDKVTNDNYAKDIIKLPSTPDGSPNWKYMEEYMRKIEQRTQTAISALAASKNKPHKIDTTYWKEFVMNDLFEIVKGKRLTKFNMREGNINYIGATSFNNGITAKISNEKYIHSAGKITVCYNGSIGQTFYQNEPFWATDDVNVLYPKFKMSRFIALFLSPIISKIGSNYAYIDKWTVNKMRSSKILLPATPAGEPDWHYMEMYMRGVEAIAKEKIALLTKKKQEPLQQTSITNYGTVNIYEK